MLRTVSFSPTRTGGTVEVRLEHQTDGTPTITFIVNGTTAELDLAEPADRRAVEGVVDTIQAGLFPDIGGGR